MDKEELRKAYLDGAKDFKYTLLHLIDGKKFILERELASCENESKRKELECYYDFVDMIKGVTI